MNEVMNDQAAIELTATILRQAEASLGGDDLRAGIDGLRKAIDGCNADGLGIMKSDESLLRKLHGAANTARHAPDPARLMRMIAEVIVLGHIWMDRVGPRPFNVAMARSGIERRIQEMLDDAISDRGRVRGLGGGQCEDCDDCQCSTGGCGSCGGGCGGGHP